MPEYVDVILFDQMDEPAEIAIEVDGKTVPMQVIKNEEAGDGWETVWRVQLQSA